MDRSFWMWDVPTAVLTLSLPPLAISKELELQGGLCSPVCKCVCVCGREREMSWVLPYQLRILLPNPPSPRYIHGGGQSPTWNL